MNTHCFLTTSYTLTFECLLSFTGRWR